jgi:3-phosphoglycerate kinase
MSPALILKLIKYGKLILKNKDKIKKYAKPVAKSLIIGGAMAYMFNWMYELEMKMIKIERDAMLDVPEKDGMP